MVLAVGGWNTRGLSGAVALRQDVESRFLCFVSLFKFDVALRERTTGSRPKLLPQLRDKIIIIVPTIGIGKFDGPLVGGIAYPGNQKKCVVGRNAHLLRNFAGSIHGAKMLQGANDGKTALLEKAIKRIANG